MQATITVRMDNAAFETDPAGELAHILRHLADRIEHQWERDHIELPLRDVNGNYIGTCKIAEDA